MANLISLLTPLGVPLDGSHFLHIGDDPPRLDLGGEAKIEVRQGPVVETILQVAQKDRVDMIAMPTAGQQGFLGALRGSTTEQVLRKAPCSVLAVHAVS